MINKVKELKVRLGKSRDGKVLVSNFGYMMLLQVSGYLFPLLTIPYLARVIGVDGFGKIAFAAAIVLWFQTVTEWGFNYTATRDVAKNRNDSNKVAEIFSNVLWAKISLMLVSLVLLSTLTLSIPYFRENTNIIFLTFLIVPGQILFPEWFFQAMERMKYVTIFGVLAKGFFTISVFIFINEKNDVLLQPLFISLGYFISGLLAMYLIIVRWNIKIKPPRWKMIWSTIRNSRDVFINNMMPNFYNSLSTVLLGFYGGSISNGMLDAGRKFVEISQQFLALVSRVFFPLLSRKMNSHRIYAKIQISLSIMFALALIAFSPLLIAAFFTPEFEAATLVLQIMALSLVFTSLNNVYGTNYMIIQGYEKDLRNVTVLVSLAGFFMAFPLIYFWDYLGAALTITLTRALLGGSVAVKAILIRRSVTAG